MVGQGMICSLDLSSQVLGTKGIRSSKVTMVKKGVNCGVYMLKEYIQEKEGKFFAEITGERIKYLTYCLWLYIKRKFRN